nr:hypothetical protein [uncultured Draconibacterium sp.]
METNLLNLTENINLSDEQISPSKFDELEKKVLEFQSSSDCDCIDCGDCDCDDCAV